MWTGYICRIGLLVEQGKNLRYPWDMPQAVPGLTLSGSLDKGLMNSLAA